jgi:hypothetical protein
MVALSALDVATELRKRLPGVGVKKLHKLLYYCKGITWPRSASRCSARRSRRGTWDL